MSSSRQKRNRLDQDVSKAADTGKQASGAGAAAASISRFSKPGFKTGNELPPFVQSYKPYSGGLNSSLLETHTNCGKQWDSYYAHNGLNGYKDRHYILREFVELGAALEAKLALTPKEEHDGNRLHWMEVGCGVGNTVLPYLAPAEEEEEDDAQPRVSEEEKKGLNFAELLKVTCLDISSVAIRLLRENALFKQSGGMHQAHVHDLSMEPLTKYFQKDGGVVGTQDTTLTTRCVVAPPQERLPHFVTMIFVMCSIPLERHARTVQHLGASIRSGGVLYFRDYSTSDMAEKRFQLQDGKKQTTVGEDYGDHTYVRSNGTLSHFFSEEEVVALFTQGEAKGLFELVHIGMVERTVVNRSTDLAMERRWLHARFRKL